MFLYKLFSIFILNNILLNLYAILWEQYNDYDLLTTLINEKGEVAFQDSKKISNDENFAIINIKNNVDSSLYESNNVKLKLFKKF